MAKKATKSASKKSAPAPKKVAKPAAKKVVSTKPKPVAKKAAKPEVKKVAATEKKIVAKPIEEKKLVLPTPPTVEAKTEAVADKIEKLKEVKIKNETPKHIHGKQTYGDKTIHVYFITDVEKRKDGGGLLTPETGEKKLAVSAKFMYENQPKANNYFIIGAGGTMSYLSPSEFEATYHN